MPNSSQEILGSIISGLPKSNPSEVIGILTSLTDEIRRLNPKQRDEYFEKLLISFSLFYQLSAKKFDNPQQEKQILLKFFEEFGKIRSTHNNKIRDANLGNFKTLAQKIIIDELSPFELRHFATNLDLIGLEANAVFADKAAVEKFLAKGLQQLNASRFKGGMFIKNSVHFLLHCKNLGLLSKETAPELMAQVSEILQNISNFVISYGENLNFSTSDSQSCLDVFLYAKHVLGLEIDDNAENIIARLNQESARPTEPSKVQSDIFDSIVDFFRNKEGEDGEWQHIPTVETSGAEKKMVFAGILAITIEGAILEKDGAVEKRADIVVSNIKTGEIILVIEVDGPSHFLGSKITGKTRARNELATALFKDRHWVIDFSKFGFYRTLSQQISSDFNQENIEELKFLKELSELLQKELDKIAAANREEKMESGGAAAQRPSSQPLETAKKEDRKKAAPKKITKNKEEIAAELLRDFYEIVNLKTIDDEALARLHDILYNKIFMEIPRDKFTEPPFDIALKNFNQATEKANATILLNLLAVEGFECQNRDLILPGIDYPQELYGALGKEKPQEKSKLNPLMVMQARYGNFNFMKVLSREGFLAQLTSEEDQQIISDLAKILLEKNPKAAPSFFGLMKSQPWFLNIEQAIFAEAITSSNDEIALFFLKGHKETDREFFTDFFTKNPNLISKIFDFQQYKTSELLKSKIDLSALPKEAVEQLAYSSDARHAREQKLMMDIIAMIADATSPKAMVIQAQSLISSSKTKKSGAEKDRKEAEEILKNVLEDKSLDLETKHQATLSLHSLLRDQERHKEAVTILRTIAKLEGDDSSAMACYILYEYSKFSPKILEEEEGLLFLKRAADLKFPKAIAHVGSFHITGERNTEKNIDLGISMLKKAAELGDVNALAILGGHYMCQAVSPDVRDPKEMRKSGMDLLRKAASEGDVDAIIYLGRCYNTGYCETDQHPDTKKALFYFRKAIEILKKDPDKNKKAIQDTAASILEIEATQKDLQKPTFIPLEERQDPTYHIAKSVEVVNEILLLSNIKRYRLSPSKKSPGYVELTIPKSKMSKSLISQLELTVIEFEMNQNQEDDIERFFAREGFWGGTIDENYIKATIVVRIIFPNILKQQNAEAIDRLDQFLKARGNDGLKRLGADDELTKSSQEDAPVEGGALPNSTVSGATAETSTGAEATAGGNERT